MTIVITGYSTNYLCPIFLIVNAYFYFFFSSNKLYFLVVFLGTKLVECLGHIIWVNNLKMFRHPDSQLAQYDLHSFFPRQFLSENFKTSRELSSYRSFLLMRTRETTMLNMSSYEIFLKCETCSLC